MPESSARRPSPVVLLLGAGASVDAGLPTVQQLVTSFDAYLEEHGSDRQREAASFIMRVLADHDLAQAGRRIVDVELLMASLSGLMTRDDGIASPFVRQWFAEVGRYEREFPRVLKHLQDHIREQCSVDPGTVEYLHAIREFVDRYGQLDVFTLNYDSAIEIVCQQQDIPYTDGFDLYWNPMHFESDLFRLRLFKMHGSLLWYQTMTRSRRLVKIPVKGSDTDELRFFTDEPVENLLMYPAFVKSQHVDPYATLMGYFREALRDAKVLVCIGCSFRDEYIKQVLIEKMGENPNLSVVVVDPDVPNVLSVSDDIVGEDWSFASVAARVSGVRRAAAPALTASGLIRYVREVEEGQEYAAEFLERLLAGDEAEAKSNADEYISRIIERRDLGAIQGIVAQSGSLLLERLIASVRTLGPGDPTSFRRAPATFVVAAGIPQDSGYRVLLRDSLGAFISWVFQYAVWKRGSYFTTNASSGVVRFDSAHDFFSSHEHRVHQLTVELDEWCPLFRFWAPELADAADSLMESTHSIERYFRESADDHQYQRFASMGGETNFPRGRNDSVMEALNQFMDSEHRLPKALVQTLY